MPANPARRRAKIIAALLITTLCTACLWSSLCGTSDITDDPSANGGYNSGAVFFLQTPIAVYQRRYACALPFPITDPSDIEIPAGCRLQIVRVTSLYGMFTVAADNIPRMSAEAKPTTDGPLAGTVVAITGISARTPGRRIKLDPTFLQSTPPKPTPASNSISLSAAMNMLQSLPETQSFLKLLVTKRRSIAFIQDPPYGDQLEFSVSEDTGDHLALWNRFRIDPSGEITVWLPPDDSWIDLQVWREKNRP